MDWQGLWQLVQPYIAGRIRHFLAALAGALIAKHVIQGDQASAFVDIGYSIVIYLAAEVWSILAANVVPLLRAEKKRLEDLLGQRAQNAMNKYQAIQAAKAQAQQPSQQLMDDLPKASSAPSVVSKP